MKEKTNCLFCKIINKKINSKIIFENNLVIVFLDVNPIDIGHCLILPKKHKENILKLNLEELKELSIIQQKITNLIKNKLNPKGFNFLNNFNYIAGQIINHYHIHIIPKYEKEKGFIGIIKKKISLIDIEETWKKLTKN